MSSQVGAPRAASKRARAMSALALASVALLCGCHTRQTKELKRATAALLYANAHQALRSNDIQYAIRQYEALESRFPFSPQARQGRLDLIYVYYRKGDKDAATDAAEEFLRENPTHPRVDYAYYMEGMINFERTPFAIERWFGVNMARRPPSTALKAITAFSKVVTQYPKSIYAHDSLRRLVYLRNRLAEYEIFVARYYIKRGAYMAAAQRAQGVIDQYDGAPAQRDALLVLADCYRRIGLNELAANVDRVYQTNYAAGAQSAASGHHWWAPWR
ncbi:MAG: outer membrane protein assembly factor BamD [Steroidobacteraceae bacterium]